MSDILVSIDVNGGTGEPAAVDQAGVIEGVAEYGIALAGKRTDKREIGGIPAAENERALRFLPIRQSAFEGGTKEACNRTPAQTLPHRRHRASPRRRPLTAQAHIPSQGEVIVRREVD